MTKYEMCLIQARTMLYWAQIQKSNGNDGWVRSVESGKKLVLLAIEIKKEEDLDKTAEYKQVA